MRYPDFLKIGDTIGFAAPSFGCSIEPYRSCFDRAQKVLEKKGYGILLGNADVKEPLRVFLVEIV